MDLLRDKTKRQGYKLVGASLPPRIHTYMSLYCVAKAQSKSKLIKELLDKWLVKQKEIDSENDLIQEVVERVQSSWAQYKTTHYKASVADFSVEISKEMEGKGLDIEVIKFALKQIKDGEKKPTRTFTK